MTRPPSWEGLTVHEKTIGHYYGHLVYWFDLMHIYHLHETPPLAALCSWLAAKIRNIEYWSHKRRADRELTAWQIERAS